MTDILIRRGEATDTQGSSCEYGGVGHAVPSQGATQDTEAGRGKGGLTSRGFGGSVALSTP